MAGQKKFFLDYFFYRFFRFYIKKEKHIPLFTSILFLWIFEFTIVFFIANVMDLAVKWNNYEFRELASKVFFISTMIIFMIVNVFRYGSKKRVMNILKYYSESKYNHKFKTWMFFMLPVANFLITMGMIVLVTELKR